MLKKINKILFYFIIFFVVSSLVWFGHLLKGGGDAAILMYHSIGQTISGAEGLSVSEETFAGHMAFLKRHHYNVISALELAELLKLKKKIPPRTVVITFDDGYMNNYTKAFPILKKYNIAATVFVIVDFLGKEKLILGQPMKFMTRKMVKEMSDSRLITIGSHTLRHAYLPYVEDEQSLREEIFGSKQLLEGIIKKPVYAFSYPIGGYTCHIQEQLIAAGYKVAVTTLVSKGCKHDNLYALKRIKVTPNSKNPFIFFVAASGYYIKMKETGK